MNKEYQNAYQAIYSKMQPVIMRDATNSTSIELLGNCEFCLRSPSETRGEGVLWVDSYRSENKICKTCNIFVEQLPTVLGYERGSIGYKISSFKGGYLAIPKDPNRQVELWVGGKYLDRVVDDQDILIVPITGNLAKYEMCERIGEYDVVTEISLRREMFLRHLRKSNSNNLYIATDAGSIELNKKDYQDLRDAFTNESLDPKVLLSIITMINSIQQGSTDMTYKAAQEVMGMLSDKTLVAIENIKNPASILYMMSGLRVGLTNNKVEK